MDFQNVTKNQHFVSQAEQRLNAFNPLAKEENQKIYSFSLEDRESYLISLDSDRGFKISNTLSLNDIFSFDILEKEAARYNFENLFHKYEAGIKKNTDSLISKISTADTDIKPEILNIFMSKFVNFVRNPYSIKKMLNTFPQLKNIHPTDPVHYKNFHRVLNGIKPQQNHLCSQLEITSEEYTEWLSVIFLLLTPLNEDQPNLLEQTIKGLFENSNLLIIAKIYIYDDNTCLLSDRGYSTPLSENDYMALDFNLYSHGFVRYIFGNVNSLISETVPKELVEEFKKLPKSIHVQTAINDLSTLEEYNKNVIYQCRKNVFNSSKYCYGI